jgi:large subunit ribosomal protein L17
MRHQKAGVKLNRTGSHRNAMFRNMVTSLFEHGRIHTTDAKAKELRRWADRIITLAKRGDLHARRQALSIVRSKAVVHKLFEEVSTRFGKRAGGYTRVVKLGRRLGDAAPVSLVELVGPEEKKAKKPKRKKPAKVTERAVKPQASVQDQAEKAADDGEAAKAAAPEPSATSGEEVEPPVESATEAEEGEEPQAEAEAPVESAGETEEASAETAVQDEDSSEEKVDKE